MDLANLFGSVVSGAASGPIGIALGGVLGLGQKYMDYKDRKLQQEENEKIRQHELKVIDKEADRAEGLANIHADETIEATRFKAMAEGYKNDKATYSTGLLSTLGGGWFHRFIKGFFVCLMASVDFFRGMVRPTTTAYYQLLQLFLAVWATKVLSDAFTAGVLSFDIDQFAIATLLKLVDSTIAGAGCTLAWYFTSRPNRAS